VANEWIVEFTDEFELWWLELSELVQEKCAAVVDLLTPKGLILDSLIRLASGERYMRCGNCVSNAAGIHIEFSMHLIRNEMRC